MKQPKPKDKRIAILAGYVKRGEFRISQMADEIGVTEMTVYNWVDGKSGVSRLASPRVDMFLRRAKRLAQVNAQERAQSLVDGR